MEPATTPAGDELLLLEALVARKPRAPKKPVTIAALRKALPSAQNFEDTLAKLVAQGQVINTSGKYAIHPDAFAALPAPARKAPARRSTQTDALRELEARLNAKLDRILELLAPAERKPPASKEQIAASIPGAVRLADQRGSHGGLVPIPEVRRLVLQQTGATRAEFDEALLAMERDFRIDLKIADDSHRSDAAEGIQVPGRGLVYYAISK